MGDPVQFSTIWACHTLCWKGLWHSLPLPAHSRAAWTCAGSSWTAALTRFWLVCAQGIRIPEELQGRPGFLQTSLCHTQESTSPREHIALISQVSFSLETSIFDQIRVLYREKIWLWESVLKWRSELVHWTIHSLSPCLHHCGLSALHMWWFMMLTSSWSSLTISQKSCKKRVFWLRGIGWDSALKPHVFGGAAVHKNLQTFGDEASF